HRAANDGTADEDWLQQQVLDRCLAALADSPGMTGEELATLIMDLGPTADKHLVNKLLFHKASDRVARDSTSGRYRLKGHEPDQPVMPSMPTESTTQESETVVKRRWKAGGVVVVPAFPEWQAIVRDQGHRRGFNICIMYGDESRPRRVERTKD